MATHTSPERGNSEDSPHHEIDVKQIINSIAEDEIYPSFGTVRWTSSQIRNLTLSLSAELDQLIAADGDAASLRKLASLWATLLVMEDVWKPPLTDVGHNEAH